MAEANENVNPLDELRREYPTVVDTLESQIRSDYESRFEVWKKEELVSLEIRQEKELHQLVQEYMQKLEEEQKPLSKDQIQALLEQDYVEFTVKVKNPETGDIKTLVISELPEEIERKFFRKIKATLIDKAPELAALSQEQMDRPLEDKIKAFLDAFDGAFEMLVEACVLILNPRGKNEIDNNWVSSNLTSYRMWNIVKAQMEVNKLRDFFFELSQNGMKAQTMTSPVSVQNLQSRLAR